MPDDDEVRAKAARLIAKMLYRFDAPNATATGKQHATEDGEKIAAALDEAGLLRCLTAAEAVRTVHHPGGPIP